MAKRICYDSFVRECRANSRPIKEKINGLHSPFCHGWVEVPSKTEIDVARKFNIQPFLWGRNLDMENQLVRGIIFDYCEGVSIVYIPLTMELNSRYSCWAEGDTCYVKDSQRYPGIEYFV